jgi:HEAT repeat protein
VKISTLGNTKDPHVIEPFLKIATDPEKPKGKQSDFGEALAYLGDHRAAEPVTDMIRYADNWASSKRLHRAYDIRS